MGIQEGEKNRLNISEKLVSMRAKDEFTFLPHNKVQKVR
jgi:hypothetical protein